MRSGGGLARLFVLGTALLGVACGEAAPPAGSARGEPADRPSDARQAEEEVVAAHRALVRAFEARDAQAVAALLDPAPGLLIFHPFVENRFDGSIEAREGLARMFTRLSRLEWTEVHQELQVEGRVAWLSAQVLLQSPDLARPFVGRGTEIWVRRDGGWRLTHGHWSEHAGLEADRR